MLGKIRKLLLVVVLVGTTFGLSACGSKFAEGDPYYYTLQQITGNHDENNVQLYIIDPFEGKVIDGADAIEFDEIPDLEEYKDTEESLFIKYNSEKTDHFEKKSDSLWVSLESGVEYDAKRKEGPFDYTPVKYELPWEEDSEASEYLRGQTFTKYSGEGANQLSFKGDGQLIISPDDILPPYIENLADYEDYEGNKPIIFEAIELKDGESGDFIVIYEGKELLKLIVNEDGLIETEDGTTYMKN